MRRTHRGFALYTQVIDDRNQVVRVQRSSAIGPRRVWVFCDMDGNGQQPEHHLGRCNPCCAYLSPQQARMVAKGLLLFADGKE